MVKKLPNKYENLEEKLDKSINKKPSNPVRKLKKKTKRLLKLDKKVVDKRSSNLIK